MSIFIYAAIQPVNFLDVKYDIPELNGKTIKYGMREFFV